MYKQSIMVRLSYLTSLLFAVLLSPIQGIDLERLCRDTGYLAPVGKGLCSCEKKHGYETQRYTDCVNRVLKKNLKKQAMKYADNAIEILPTNKQVVKTYNKVRRKLKK